MKGPKQALGCYLLGTTSVLLALLLLVGCASPAGKIATSVSPTAAVPSPTASAALPTPTSPATQLPARALSYSELGIQAGKVYAAMTQDWAVTAEADRLYGEAQKEGSVFLYLVGNDEDLGKALKAAFERRFPGILLEHRTIPTARIVPVYVAEREAGRATADVQLFPMPRAAALADRGWVASVDWQLLGVDPRRGVLQNKAVAVYHGPYLHSYRNDRIPQEELPKTLFELLDPKWKDKLCSTEGFMQVGSSFTAIYYDLERTVQWAKDLIEKQNMLITPDCDRLLLSGERLLFLQDYGSNAPKKLHGKPIGLFFTDGLGVILSTSAVMDNAPHPNAARLLAAWLTSRESSEVGFKVDGHGWVGFGHAVPELSKRAQGGLGLVFESQETFQERAKLQAEFTKRVFPRR